MESTLGMTDLSHTRSHLEDLTIVQWFPNDRNIQNTWSGGSSPPLPSKVELLSSWFRGFWKQGQAYLSILIYQTFFSNWSFLCPTCRGKWQLQEESFLSWSQYMFLYLYNEVAQQESRPVWQRGGGWISHRLCTGSAAGPLQPPGITPFQVLPIHMRGFHEIH